MSNTIKILCGSLKCRNEITFNTTTCGEPECAAIWEGYLKSNA